MGKNEQGATSRRAGRGAAAAQERPVATPAHERARTHVRKGARERLGIPRLLRFFLVTLVVVGFSAGSFLLWRQLTGASRARNQISFAISAVADADESVVILNEAVSAEIGSSTTASPDELAASVESARDSLVTADEHIVRARQLDEFLDDNQRAVLDALRSSIDARREMLVAGESIVATDNTVAQALDALDQAVELAKQAGAKAVEAAQAANSYALYLAGQQDAQSDAQVAVTLDNEVISLLSQASSSLAQAKEGFASADYTAYEAYLAKRDEAASLMLQSDSAVASGDFESASELVERYNEADAVASELAAALPATTSDIFVEPYAAATEEARASYVAASQKAAEADALVRRYQGVSVSTTGAAATADKEGVASGEVADDAATEGSAASSGAASDAAASDVAASSQTAATSS